MVEPWRQVPRKVIRCLALLAQCVRGPDRRAHSTRWGCGPAITTSGPCLAAPCFGFSVPDALPSIFSLRLSRRSARFSSLPAASSIRPVPDGNGQRAWWISDWGKHLSRPPPTPTLVIWKPRHPLSVV